jgi:hypothetical protein
MIGPLRQRGCVVGRGVRQGVSAKVSPADARGGRNLKEFFDDRRRKLATV